MLLCGNSSNRLVRFLGTKTQHRQNRNVLLVLLDDRRDGTVWQDINGTQHSPRNWDGYANYPSRGEKRVSGLLNPKDLYNKLLESVSLQSSDFHELP